MLSTCVKTVKDPLFLVYVCELEQDEESLYTVQICVPRSNDSKEDSEVAENIGCTILFALHMECSVSNLVKNRLKIKNNINPMSIVNYGCWSV